MSMGRILGFDYGDRNIGVAISDDSQTVATPRDTIVYTARVFMMESIEDLLEDDDIDLAVVGLPLGMSGEDTKQTERTREFAKMLEDYLGMDVVLEDERLTSSLAKGSVKNDPAADDLSIDAGAAQAILQGYLDRKAAESSS